MCMVGAGEQKLCPAGDGSKFSDDKFVMVDRIVVQYIVFLKLPWVIDEVVIHGEIPDKDVGILDDIFQINGFVVVSARINIFWINGFPSSLSYENSYLSICEKWLFST